MAKYEHLAVMEFSHLRPDLCDRAAAIRSGELTATDLVEQCRRNIIRLNDHYNAFVHLNDEGALEEAAILDAELQEGGLRGPLHGIPLAVKDNVDTVGIETTAGSRVLIGNRPEADAPLVARLREAGAIIIGKTNMDEFAYGFSTENEHYGNARNPYDPDRVAGGSSGGSALAVALEMSCGAIGTDTNGSIRVPASFCGVVGLRPTYGRVSRRGIVPLAASMDQAGPITRSVRDAALVLSAIASFDAKDPESQDELVPNYAGALDEMDRSMRIGIPRGHFFEGADPGVISCVEAGLRKLAGEGQDLVEIDLVEARKGRKSASEITTVEAAEAATGEMIERAEHLFDRKVLARLKARADVSNAEYERAKAHAAIVRAELLSTFENVDVVATPTCPLPPIFMGEEPKALGGVLMLPSRYLGLYTSVFGLAGLPSVSVPCGFTSNGLPVGMQLVGPPFQEARLLQIARLLERVMGLANMRPLVL